MIFSNRIYRITSGNSPQLYAKDSQNMELFIFNEQPLKNTIVINDSIIRCFNTLTKFDCDHACRIDENLICKSFEENMLIVEDKL